MSSPLLIMTWLWRQTPDKHGYFKDGGGADKVNVWATGVRRNCSLDIELGCVTDEPEGIDPSIRVIPLPRAFDHVYIKAWSEKAGAPQCLRRLDMFREDAAEIFGAERFVSMDLDCVFPGGKLNSLFDNDCDFVMFKGTSRQRPYNGSMMQMRAGARSVVYETFAADPQEVATRARRKYIGSDQAVISMILGRGEETWGVEDGVEAYGGGFMRRHGRQPRRIRLPDTVKIVFFPGPTKPWQLLDRVGFIAENWHDGVPRGKTRGSMNTAPAPGVAPTMRNRPASRIPPFFAFDDNHKWGRSFKQAADELTRRPTRLFIREGRVPPGSKAFVRLDARTKYGEPGRNTVATLHRRGVITLPTLEDAALFFDRSERRAKLGQHLAATAEGIPAVYRICAIGGHLYGMNAKTRQSVEFNTRGERKAGKLVAGVVRELRLKCVAFDIVFERDESKIADLVLAWSVPAYAQAAMFDLELKRLDRMAGDSFRVAVETLGSLTLHAETEDEQAKAG